MLSSDRVESLPAHASVKRTLVVHPSAQRRAELISALLPYQTDAVSTVEDALRLIHRAEPSILIAEAGGAKRLLKELDLRNAATTKVFLCPMSDVDSIKRLLEVAAEGHVFTTVDDGLSSGEIAQRVGQLLQGRTSARTTVTTPLIAQFELDGRSYDCEVMDVSLEGLGLRLKLDGSVGSFLPGALLSHLRVRSSEAAVLGVDHAFVRHIRADKANLNTLAIGVSFPEPAAHLVVEQTLKDSVRVLGMLRRAIARRGHLRIRSIDDRTRVLELRAPKLDAIESQLLLHGALSENTLLSPGDIFELMFDVTGTSYTGLAAVAPLFGAKPGRVAFFVPKTLSVRHRRSRTRFPVRTDRPFAVSFVSPLNGERVVRPVQDLQTHGFSFLFDAASEVFPPGLLLENVDLILPDGTSAACRATIRDNGPSNGNPHATGFSQPRRCGASLIDVPAKARTAILDAFVSERCPAIGPATPESFDDIWAIVRGAEGHYPDYSLDAGPHLEVLRQAHQRLTRAGDGLGKSLIYKDGADPVGHASGLRYYSRTWVLQHLAVRPSFTRDRFIGRDLSTLIVEYAETLDDVEFARKIWNQQNRWVNRLGGWVARTMRNDGLSHLRYFNYMHRPATALPPTLEKLPTVRPGEISDLRWLEAYLARTDQSLRLRADDLSASEFDLSALGARYAKAGLHRARKLFVAGDGNEPLGVAIVEEATLGLHWGEFINAFSLSVPPSGTEAPATRDALVRASVQHYEKLGRPSALALVDDADVPALRKLGFQWLGRFAELTFHRSNIQTWAQLSSAIFERVQRATDRAGLHASVPSDPPHATEKDLTYPPPYLVGDDKLGHG